MLLAVVLKFYPLSLNILSKGDKERMDKSKLSKYLFTSFSVLGLLLLALSFIGEVSEIISVPLIFVSILSIGANVHRFVKK